MTHSTAFVAGTTLASTWLNDVNSVVFTEAVYSSFYTTLQLAVTAAAGKTLYVTGTWTITSAVTVSSDTRIVLQPGSIVQTATADISHFNCTSKSNVIITGPGKIKKTGVGTAAYVAGVLLTSATNCQVSGVEFEGMQWTAVYMNGATNCTASHNYVHDHLGTVQDASAFVVHGNSVACSVEGNKTNDTGYCGILVQDADASAGIAPTRTRVINNDINGATAYGICVYELTASDTDTLIDGNSIRSITGTNPTNSGGAGIYIKDSGGVTATGNRIRYCCTSTSNNTLTPGGIGVNIATTGITAPVIDGNSITDIGMTSAGVSNANSVSLSGIAITSVVGANVSDNSIRQGAGLTPAVYVGIWMNAASHVVATGNKLDIATTLAASEGVFIYANGVSGSNITLAGNTIKGCANSHIRVDQTGGFSTTSIAISGGVLSGGGTSCIPIRLGAAVVVAIDGVIAVADTVAAFSISACTQVRVSGGSLTSSGTVAIATTGTCTGGHLSKATYFGASAAKITNAGTGFIVDAMLTAVPAAGTWAVGDHWIQTVSVSGAAPGGFCTVAGAPGTWKAESNLA